MNWWKLSQAESGEVVCRDGFCYRIDSERIPAFRNNPYIMYPTGSSSVVTHGDRASMLPRGQRRFEGLYAADSPRMIAPYALPRDVPWVMIYHVPDRENPLGLDESRPTVYLHRADADRDHPPVYLSKFKGSDFRPRHEVTREFFGDESTDTGDDEFISTSPEAPRHLEQREIGDTMAFLRSHADVRLIEPRSDGTPNFGAMADVVHSVEGVNRMVHGYSMIVTDGRGHTEVEGP